MTSVPSSALSMSIHRHSRMQHHPETKRSAASCATSPDDCSTTHRRPGRGPDSPALVMKHQRRRRELRRHLHDRAHRRSRLAHSLPALSWQSSNTSAGFTPAACKRSATALGPTSKPSTPRQTRSSPQPSTASTTKPGLRRSREGSRQTIVRRHGWLAALVPPRLGFSPVPRSRPPTHP
jgi:hypothetical protein